jgi:hypothetical protein
VVLLRVHRRSVEESAVVAVVAAAAVLVAVRVPCVLEGIV